MTTKEKDLTDKMELNKRKQEKIDALLKDKESNEKEIRERDKTISDKEHRIFDLKKQNQELEKSHFLLLPFETLNRVLQILQRFFVR